MVMLTISKAFVSYSPMSMSIAAQRRQIFLQGHRFTCLRLCQSARSEARCKRSLVDVRRFENQAGIDVDLT